jgi:glycosyltransferase 2 family protein
MDMHRPERAMSRHHDESALQIGLGGFKKRGFQLKLVSGALLFCGFTFLVFYYQFSRMGGNDAAFSWHRLHFVYLWLLLGCLPIDTCASALRIWLVCRVLKSSAGYWTCLKAEWANVGLAMLTPTQTGGGLGQIYILSRHNIAFPTATTISLITFLGTMLALLGVGLCSVLFFGAHPGYCLTLVVWPMTLVLGVMTLPLLWPGLFRVAIPKVFYGLSETYAFSHRMLFRCPDWSDNRLSRLERAGTKLASLACQYHCDTWRFVREGGVHFICICLLSLVFILARCFMAFLCLRFLGVETSSLGEVLKIQMALLFVLYLAPTPGGSGIAEFFSLSAMSAVIPAEVGPYYNLLWRASTLYVPASLGLLVLALALLRDTGRLFRLRASLTPRVQRAQAPSAAQRECVRVEQLDGCPVT